MMNAKRTLGCVCALTVSVLSVGAQAAPEQKGLQACVDAMAVKLADAQGGSPVVAHISEESMGSNRQLGLSTTFNLDAYTVDAGEVVARMDCTVNVRGQVLRLVRLPEHAKDARTRSL
jgi:hypothetical protein